MEFNIDYSQYPKRLLYVKENGIDISKNATFEQGSKNGFVVVLGGKVRIEKHGANTYQQVVVGGKPGAINCVGTPVPKVTAPIDVY